MIAYLSGTILRKWDKQVIMSAGGVGYLLNVGNDLMSSLQVNAEDSLYIHTKVKEDDISLFAFREENELRLFQQLIGISGIGTKTAMAMLDTPLQLLYQAIESEDAAELSKVPGLGKKTASRVILELKGKLDIGLNVNTETAVPRSLQEEAMEALISLGYDKPSIIRFINETPETFDTAEEVVTAFLKNA